MKRVFDARIINYNKSKPRVTVFAKKEEEEEEKYINNALTEVNAIF